MAWYALLYQFLSCPFHLVSAVEVHHSDVKKLAKPTKDAIIVFIVLFAQGFRQSGRVADNDLCRAGLGTFSTKHRKPLIWHIAGHSIVQMSLSVVYAMPLEHRAHIVCIRTWNRTHRSLRRCSACYVVTCINQFWAGSAGSHVTPAPNTATVAMNLPNRIDCAMWYSMYVRRFVLAVQCDPSS